MRLRTCLRIGLVLLALSWASTSACRREEKSPGPPPATPSASVSRSPADTSIGLIHAAAAGEITPIKELLAAGADVNVRGPSGQTPLMEAAYGGYTEIARLLLDNGANISLKKNDGATARLLAEGGKHAEIVELLNQVEQLLAAAGKGDQKAVTALVDKGASVNGRGEDGRTALMEAAYGGHTTLVKLLLEKGADVRPVKTDGATALSIAEGGKYKEIVELLKTAGAK